MTVNKLEKRALLKRVNVHRPTDSIIEAANLRSTMMFGNRMCGFTCGDNSISVVVAMQASGESDWHIVPGFAFPFGQKKPTVHVWVKKGQQHYEPTWIFWNWQPEFLSYYELLQPVTIVPNDNLMALRDLASKWGLKLAEDLH